MSTGVELLRRGVGNFRAVQEHLRHSDIQARGRFEGPLNLISISFPFGGVIPGVSGVFRGLARRRAIAREHPENPD
jgi:hypothetical protein